MLSGLAYSIARADLFFLVTGPPLVFVSIGSPDYCLCIQYYPIGFYVMPYLGLKVLGWEGVVMFLQNELGEVVERM